jgi:hypothetical protein
MNETVTYGGAVAPRVGVMAARQRPARTRKPYTRQRDQIGRSEATPTQGMAKRQERGGAVDLSVESH